MRAKTSRMVPLDVKAPHLDITTGPTNGASDSSVGLASFMARPEVMRSPMALDAETGHLAGLTTLRASALGRSASAEGAFPVVLRAGVPGAPDRPTPSDDLLLHARMVTA